MQRVFFALALMLWSAAAFAQPPGSGAATDGFVPAGSLPAVEQLPAAPLLIGAYAAFLVLMMVYLWTIWRRIGKVEADMQALARRQAGGR
jgi:type VI protein secretion system component VasF